MAASLFGDDIEQSWLGFGLLIVERVVSGHGWDGRVDIDGGTRYTFSGVGTVTQTPSLA